MCHTRVYEKEVFVILFKMVSKMATRLSLWYQMTQEKYLIVTKEIYLYNVSHRFLNDGFSLIHCLKIISLMLSDNVD